MRTKPSLQLIKFPHLVEPKISGYIWNRLAKTVLIPGPKPLLTDLGILNRWDSCGDSILIIHDYVNLDRPWQEVTIKVSVLVAECVWGLKAA